MLTMGTSRALLGHRRRGRSGTFTPPSGPPDPIQPDAVAGLTHWWEADTGARQVQAGPADPVNGASSELLAGGNYAGGEEVDYRVFAFYSNPLFSLNGLQLNTVVMSAPLSGASLSWDVDPAVDGYRILRSVDGAGYLDFQDVGPVGTLTDDGTGWGLGSTVTPKYVVLGGALNDGDPCRAWLNKYSGTEVVDGTEAVQLDNNQAPLYKTGIQNGLAGLLFQGTDDSLETAAFVAQPVGTEFVLFKLSLADDGQFVADGEGRHLALVTTTSDFKAAQDGGTFGVLSPIPGVVDTSIHLAVVAFAGNATSRGYMDGALKFTANIGTGAGCTTRIFGAAQGGGGNMTGYYFARLRYDRVLTPFEIAGVSQYLADKWGLTINTGGGALSQMPDGSFEQMPDGTLVALPA